MRSLCSRSTSYFEWSYANTIAKIKIEINTLIVNPLVGSPRKYVPASIDRAPSPTPKTNIKNNLRTFLKVNHRILRCIVIPFLLCIILYSLEECLSRVEAEFPQPLLVCLSVTCDIVNTNFVCAKVFFYYGDHIVDLIGLTTKNIEIHSVITFNKVSSEIRSFN